MPSKYDFEKNIELTKEIVELAKAYDASVEGEIGVIHGTEDEHSADESTFTKPAEAVEFIKKDRSRFPCYCNRNSSWST